METTQTESRRFWFMFNRHHKRHKAHFPVSFIQLSQSESTSPLNDAMVEEYHDNEPKNHDNGDESQKDSNQNNTEQSSGYCVYVQDGSEIGHVENPMYDETESTKHT